MPIEKRMSAILYIQKKKATAEDKHDSCSRNNLPLKEQADLCFNLPQSLHQTKGQMKYSQTAVKNTAQL